MTDYGIYREDEPGRWRRANQAGRQAFRNRWYDSMLVEAMDDDDDIDEDHFETVLQYVDNVKRYLRKQGDVVVDPRIGIWCITDNLPVNSADSIEFRKWADENPGRMRAAITRPVHGYAASKFRFFRQMQRLLSITASVLEEYQNACEFEQRIWEWEDFNIITFRNFCEKPEYYSEEAQEERRRDYDYVQRMANSDASQTASE